ncbi:MAG: hypothetical protein K0U16_07700 [Gammaproteobacteria bacterium]|nr:hypothetical protein [Gammaproteobacteria bacterium]
MTRPRRTISADMRPVRRHAPVPPDWKTPPSGSRSRDEPCAYQHRPGSQRMGRARGGVPRRQRVRGEHRGDLRLHPHAESASGCPDDRRTTHRQSSALGSARALPQPIRRADHLRGDAAERRQVSPVVVAGQPG